MRALFSLWGIRLLFLMTQFLDVDCFLQWVYVLFGERFCAKGTGVARYTVMVCNAALNARPLVSCALSVQSYLGASALPELTGGPRGQDPSGIRCVVRALCRSAFFPLATR